MQLVSFQIKECFGFRDSGQVNLQNPTNLIYLLGRNSAGKTSFLTALAHFAPSLKPQAHQNFANFDPSAREVPCLLGEYRVGRGNLTVDVFVKAFRDKIDALNHGAPNTIGSNEYKRLTDEQIRKIRTIYTEFIEEIVREGTLWVQRTGSGDYQFSTTSSFVDYTDRRRQQISDLLINLPGQLKLQVNANGQLFINGNSWQPFRQMTPDEIESLLAHQLPVIVRFDKAYSLLDMLPDVIKIEHLAQSSNRLTTALVMYLGKSQVERLLNGQNPIELRRIQNKLQEKINTLMGEVNRDHSEGTELLKIDLLLAPGGLQVTAITGDKQSFYRHLSDNTKFLFAYHLYMAIYNLRGNILLFDEPNNGFHATAQERLLGFLNGLGAKGNLIVVSTHSEHLIDPDHLTGVRLMVADNQGYLSIRNKWYESTAGSGDFLALRPITDAIGLKYGTNRLTIRDKVIITEGVTELLYLRAFRQLLSYQGELHIAPATGEKTIPYVVALLISQGLHFKVVVDTTVGRKSTKEELQEMYDIPDTSICEVEVPAGFPQAKGSGIEDVFSKADFAKLLMSTGNTPGADFETLSNSKYMKNPKIVPKRVVAHEFNKHVTTYSKDDFEEETLTNMRRILDFCMNDDWFQI
jgi:hypothetical protein